MKREELIKKIKRLPDGPIVERLRHWGAGGMDTITGAELKSLLPAPEVTVEELAEMMHSLFGGDDKWERYAKELMDKLDIRKKDLGEEGSV